jgi:glycerol-3-phosphate dehydrogenase
MNVAVIGGGINGIMSAWALAACGCSVDLFERDELMRATSSASTKMLHGGLRYLEQGHLGLVREALRERQWWVAAAPHLAWPLELVLPVYTWSERPRWKVRTGLTVYDWLAGAASFGKHRWQDRDQLLAHCPALSSKDLVGGFTFLDAQMNDFALGRWAAAQTASAGVNIREHASVERVSTTGEIVVDGKTRPYDRIVNVAGPWAQQLLERSGIESNYDLDLIRGSHLLLDTPITKAFLLEVPGEQRIGFVIPYEGKTLVGTTEVRQQLEEPIECSPAESEYLLNLYNHYFEPKVSETAVHARFAGVRPLIRSNDNPSRTSREYALESTGKLLTVFGGKWTTSRSLGMQVARELTGKRRIALQPQSPQGKVLWNSSI